MLSERLDALPLAPSAPSAPSTALGGTRIVALWLWCMAAAVFVMVMVGGATRLTQSGLSIVEWNPVMGVVPPLGDADWRAAFEKYQTIPQYDRLNRGMSLDEFKTIYWWEWSHRLLGRLIGAGFLLPFLWFWRLGWVDRRLALTLAGIFALGALQGAVGWWMVASGLAGRVSVSQYRLAFHLTLASVIYAALVCTADRMMARAPERTSAHFPPAKERKIASTRPKSSFGIRAGAGALLALAILQIYLGALVAGLHAGLIYNTWPLIDGHIVPPAAELFFDRPWWRNLFENALTAQFDHRMLAYGLLALALGHFANVARRHPGGALARGAIAVAVAIVAQIMIGIMTLTQAAPLGLALLHQAMALIVLTAAALHAGRVLTRGAGGLSSAPNGVAVGT
jgi:cytochrome c oxidase assembly protein subunit 15